MIPKELTTLKQWVCATKDSKIPMKATEPKAASSSDPTTWSSYEEALESVKDGNYQYLGFVFDNNGIVGIDIDKGFEDEHNVILNEMTYEILTKCHSYTELSKSGRGFHIFVKGTLPFMGKNNNKGLEIYQDGRYFVMTGKQRYYKDIIENQEAIDFIVEKYFKEEVREQKEGTIKPRIYSPIEKISLVDGKLKISNEYPDITEGSRNVSLLSLGGQFLASGMNKKQIYDKLLKINETHVKPPLKISEIQSIVNSVMKYRRTNENSQD